MPSTGRGRQRSVADQIAEEDDWDPADWEWQPTSMHARKKARNMKTDIGAAGSCDVGLLSASGSLETMPSDIPVVRIAEPTLTNPKFANLPIYNTFKKQESRSEPVCVVEGCGASLAGLKRYFTRLRICEMHLGSMAIVVDGIISRFCQQCGRFQPLQDFTGKKKSCAEQLEKVNARHREKAIVKQTRRPHRESSLPPGWQSNEPADWAYGGGGGAELQRTLPADAAPPYGSKLQPHPSAALSGSSRSVTSGQIMSLPSVPAAPAAPAAPATAANADGTASLASGAVPVTGAVVRVTSGSPLAPTAINMPPGFADQDRGGGGGGLTEMCSTAALSAKAVAAAAAGTAAEGGAVASTPPVFPSELVSGPDGGGGSGPLPEPACRVVSTSGPGIVWFSARNMTAEPNAAAPAAGAATGTLPSGGLAAASSSALANDTALAAAAAGTATGTAACSASGSAGRQAPAGGSLFWGTVTTGMALCSRAASIARAAPPSPPDEVSKALDAVRWDLYLPLSVTVPRTSPDRALAGGVDANPQQSPSVVSCHPAAAATTVLLSPGAHLVKREVNGTLASGAAGYSTAAVAAVAGSSPCLSSPRHESLLSELAAAAVCGGMHALGGSVPNSPERGTEVAVREGGIGTTMVRKERAACASGGSGPTAERPPPGGVAPTTSATTTSMGAPASPASHSNDGASGVCGGAASGAVAGGGGGEGAQQASSRRVVESDNMVAAAMAAQISGIMSALGPQLAAVQHCTTASTSSSGAGKAAVPDPVRQYGSGGAVSGGGGADLVVAGRDGRHTPTLSAQGGGGGGAASSSRHDVSPLVAESAAELLHRTAALTALLQSSQSQAQMSRNQKLPEELWQARIINAGTTSAAARPSPDPMAPAVQQLSRVEPPSSSVASAPSGSPGPEMIQSPPVKQPPPPMVGGLQPPPYQYQQPFGVVQQHQQPYSQQQATQSGVERYPGLLPRETISQPPGHPGQLPQPPPPPPTMTAPPHAVQQPWTTMGPQPPAVALSGQQVPYTSQHAGTAGVDAAARMSSMSGNFPPPYSESSFVPAPTCQYGYYAPGAAPPGAVLPPPPPLPYTFMPPPPGQMMPGMPARGATASLQQPHGHQVAPYPTPYMPYGTACRPRYVRAMSAKSVFIRHTSPYPVYGPHQGYPYGAPPHVPYGVPSYGPAPSDRMASYGTAPPQPSYNGPALAVPQQPMSISNGVGEARFAWTESYNVNGSQMYGTDMSRNTTAPEPLTDEDDGSVFDLLLREIAEESDPNDTTAPHPQQVYEEQQQRSRTVAYAVQQGVEVHRQALASAPYNATNPAPIGWLPPPSAAAWGPAAAAAGVPPAPGPPEPDMLHDRVAIKALAMTPGELPGTLRHGLGRWLQTGGAEAVQATLRPGCLQLVVDVQRPATAAAAVPDLAAVLLPEHDAEQAAADVFRFMGQRLRDTFVQVGDRVLQIRVGEDPVVQSWEQAAEAGGLGRVKMPLLEGAREAAVCAGTETTLDLYGRYLDQSAIKVFARLRGREIPPAAVVATQEQQLQQLGATGGGLTDTGDAGDSGVRQASVPTSNQLAVSVAVPAGAMGLLIVEVSLGHLLGGWWPLVVLPAGYEAAAAELRRLLLPYGVDQEGGEAAAVAVNKRLLLDVGRVLDAFAAAKAAAAALLEATSRLAPRPSSPCSSSTAATLLTVTPPGAPGVGAAGGSCTPSPSDSPGAASSPSTGGGGGGDGAGGGASSSSQAGLTGMSYGAETLSSTAQGSSRMSSRLSALVNQPGALVEVPIPAVRTAAVGGAIGGVVVLPGGVRGGAGGGGGGGRAGGSARADNTAGDGGGIGGLSAAAVRQAMAKVSRLVVFTTSRGCPHLTALLLAAAERLTAPSTSTAASTAAHTSITATTATANRQHQLLAAAGLEPQGLLPLAVLSGCTTSVDVLYDMSVRVWEQPLRWDLPQGPAGMTLLHLAAVLDDDGAMASHVIATQPWAAWSFLCLSWRWTPPTQGTATARGRGRRRQVVGVGAQQPLGQEEGSAVHDREGGEGAEWEQEEAVEGTAAAAALTPGSLSLLLGCTAPLDRAVSALVLSSEDWVAVEGAGPEEGVVLEVEGGGAAGVEEAEEGALEGGRDTIGSSVAVLTPQLQVREAEPQHQPHKKQLTAVGGQVEGGDDVAAALAGVLDCWGRLSGALLSAVCEQMERQRL